MATARSLVAGSGLACLLAVSLVGPPRVSAGSSTAAAPATSTIYTYAGGGAGDGGSAAAASLAYPGGMAFDASGDLYVTDILTGRVRKVAPSGVISTVAGKAEVPPAPPESSGPVPWESPVGPCWDADCGDGGPAINALLVHPNGVALGPNGDLYIADTGNGRVREVDQHGVITTVAGGGSTSFCNYPKLPYLPTDPQGPQRLGDGGAATRACLPSPTDIAFDRSGNLYITDSLLCSVRKVDLQGTITTIAGNGSCFDSGDGGPAVSAGFSQPDSLAFDSTGNLYVADWGEGRVRRITPAGAISTVAGQGGFVCSADYGDGAPATSAILCQPTRVRVDSAGNLLIADRGGNRVRRVNAHSGIITTVAGNGTPTYSGDGGSATQAGVRAPDAVAVDGVGNLFVSEWDTRVRRVDHRTGIISTYAGNGSGPESTPNLPGYGDGYSGDGLPATAATMLFPQALAVGPNDDLYVADTYNNRVRRVDHGTGLISTVAGTGQPGESGDGRKARAAALNLPSGIALDAAGDIYVADFEWSGSSVVRRIDRNSGLISTVAGGGSCAGPSVGDGAPATSACLRLDIPTSLVVDNAGDLVIDDGENNRVREVSASTGIITTIAGSGSDDYFCGTCGDGGPATAAVVIAPEGLTFDPLGNLYIADSDRVRKVDASTGVITSVAGSAPRGDTLFAAESYSGDGGPATQATMFDPVGIAFDAIGDLYIASGNEAVRKVDPSGTITTVAGVGEAGLGGDGGRPTLAQLSAPAGLAVDHEGNIYVADAGNSRVRVIGQPLPAGTSRPAATRDVPSGVVTAGPAGPRALPAAAMCRAGPALAPAAPAIDTEAAGWSATVERLLHSPGSTASRSASAGTPNVSGGPPGSASCAPTGQTPRPADGTANTATTTGTAATVSSPVAQNQTWRELSDGTPRGSLSTMTYDAATRSAVALAITPSLGGTLTWSEKGGVWQPQHQTPASPHLLEASLAYDAARRQVVLFAGESFQFQLQNDASIVFLAVNETWTWDGTTWSLRRPATSPSPRLNAAMSYDAATGQTLLFGGFLVDPNTGGLTPSDETWEWNGTTWRQLAPATYPSPRAGATMAYDSTHRQLLLFGGLGGTTCTSTGSGCSDQGDTWAWNGANWVQLAASGPPARAVAALADAPANGDVVLFGGAHDSYTGSFREADDTWTWDGTAWTEQHPVDVPPPRVLAAMSFSGAGVDLFGGEGPGNLDFLDDTWTWDGLDWHSDETVPSPRDGLAMAYDQARQELVVFGGNRYTKPANLQIPAAVGDTWTFDGRSWQQRHPAHSPSGGSYGVMTYDSARNQVVLLEGQGCGAKASDCDPADAGCTAMASCTWTWNGIDWTQQHPAHNPPPRATATMTYDAAAGQTVLFGGVGLDGCAHYLYSAGFSYGIECALNDTWTWDGHDWTLQHPAHNPVVRYQAGMGYDDAHGDVVLYGGWAIVDGGAGVGGFLQDTWTWDGRDWTLHRPGPQPPILRTPVLAYSSRQGRLVMFGGMYGYAPDLFDLYTDDWLWNFTGDSYFADSTWAWNGSTWSAVTTSAAPPGRGYAAAAADPATGGILVFGGTDIYHYNDLWSFGS